MGKRSVALTYFGEGCASEGDIPSALNIAAVHKAPAIFFCRNNGYAISTQVHEAARVVGWAGQSVGWVGCASCLRLCRQSQAPRASKRCSCGGGVWPLRGVVERAARRCQTSTGATAWRRAASPSACPPSASTATTPSPCTLRCSARARWRSRARAAPPSSRR